MKLDEIGDVPTCFCGEITLEGFPEKVENIFKEF